MQKSLILVGGLAAYVSAARPDPKVTDRGVSGAAMELVYLYQDQWPSGIAVSATGRMFSSFPLGLDTTNNRYQVAELTANSTDVPYPSAEFNQAPGGAFNYSTYPITGKGDPDHLIGVQSVVIDGLDRLWILDTGRGALPHDGTLAPSSCGGPKLVGVDLDTNEIFQTILFPPTVAYSTSYLNDVRFDLRPQITDSGKGVAYITDSSSEGRNGIIIVDLGSGESWRHLEDIPEVRPERGFYMNIWGESVYSDAGSPNPVSRLAFGADGITLSNDGTMLYFSVVSGRYLYGVPTARLLDRSRDSELRAAASVVNLGQKGVSDGLESDSNGIVYAASLETNSIVTYDSVTQRVETFARSPKIDWSDTFSVAGSYLYVTINQLWRGAGQSGGVGAKVPPYGLYRFPLKGNGTKILLV